MKFSQRIGKTPIKKKLQLNSIDYYLKNSLWNVTKLLFLDKIDLIRGRNSGFRKFAKILWVNYYRFAVDAIPFQKERIEFEIRAHFFASKWYEIYDFIEFIIKKSPENIDKKGLINRYNIILEKEFSGYRILNEQIVPISNEMELNELNNTIEASKKDNNLKGVDLHLKNALELLSDRKNPNYRNSIKESISALESICRIITGESTLGKSLKKMEKSGIVLNTQLKKGFENLYAYTNDKQNGIRHAIIDEHIEPDFNDAKYFLISCSAFINFIIGKASSKGISFN